MPFPATISQGDSGPVVRWAQYLLVRITLSYTQIDGIFGPVTKGRSSSSSRTTISSSTASSDPQPGPLSGATSLSHRRWRRDRTDPSCACAADRAERRQRRLLAGLQCGARRRRRLRPEDRGRSQRHSADGQHHGRRHRRPADVGLACARGGTSARGSLRCDGSRQPLTRAGVSRSRGGMTNPKGRVAIVTGAAGGIGAAIANALTHGGVTVAAVGHGQSQSEARRRTPG